MYQRRIFVGSVGLETLGQELELRLRGSICQAWDNGYGT